MRRAGRAPARSGERITEQNDYVYERLVRRTDGTTGRIDLYRRDAFVLEAKQSRQTDLSGRRGEKFVETSPDRAAWT